MPEVCRRIPASVRHHRQAAPEASAPVYPASRPRRPLSIYRKPRPLPIRRHRSPVYPASRPPFDRAPRNRSRDRFGNVTRANRGDRGDRVPEASAPVSLSGNRSTAPPPSASRHAGSERRHHRPRRKRPACQRFDRGDRAPPETNAPPPSEAATVRPCRKRPPDSGQCQRTPEAGKPSAVRPCAAPVYPASRGEHRTRRAAGSVPPDSGKPWRPFDRAPPVSLSGKPSATIERAAGFVTIGSGQPFDRAAGFATIAGNAA